MKENNVSANQVSGTGKDGRITKQDVVDAMAAGFDTSTASGWGGTRDKTPKRMSMLRRKVAERLVAVKSETRSEEHTSELQSRPHLVCRLLLEKKKKKKKKKEKS